MTGARLIACVVLLAAVGTRPADAHTENLFGAIHIDGRKAGQIHYTVEYGDGGDVETLRTATERFDFTGDWRATAWFDTRKRLVRFRYVLDGHEVVVRLDD